MSKYSNSKKHGCFKLQALERSIFSPYLRPRILFLKPRKRSVKGVNKYNSSRDETSAKSNRGKIEFFCDHLTTVFKAFPSHNESKDKKLIKF